MPKLVKPKRRIVVNPLTGAFENVSDSNFSYEGVPENKIGRAHV